MVRILKCLEPQRSLTDASNKYGAIKLKDVMKMLMLLSTACEIYNG